MLTISSTPIPMRMKGRICEREVNGISASDANEDQANGERHAYRSSGSVSTIFHKVSTEMPDLYKNGRQRTTSIRHVSIADNIRAAVVPSPANIIDTE